MKRMPGLHSANQRNTLRLALSAVKSKIHRDSKAAESIDRSILELQNRRKLLQDKVHDSQRQQGRIEANLLLFMDFSPEFLAKRSEMLKLGQQAQRKDITVKEVEDAAAEYQKCNKAFQEEYCPHRFLIGYPAYEGTYSNDYDDGHPAFRACVLCGESETARPGFKILGLASGERLLYRITGEEMDNSIKDLREKFSEQPIKAIVDLYQNAIANEYWRIERKESEPAQ